MSNFGIIVSQVSAQVHCRLKAALSGSALPSSAHEAPQVLPAHDGKPAAPCEPPPVTFDIATDEVSLFLASSLGCVAGAQVVAVAAQGVQVSGSSPKYSGMSPLAAAMRPGAPPQQETEALLHRRCFVCSPPSSSQAAGSPPCLEFLQVSKPRPTPPNCAAASPAGASSTLADSFHSAMFESASGGAGSVYHSALHGGSSLPASDLFHNSMSPSIGSRSTQLGSEGVSSLYHSSVAGASSLQQSRAAAGSMYHSAVTSGGHSLYSAASASANDSPAMLPHVSSPRSPPIGTHFDEPAAAHADTARGVAAAMGGQLPSRASSSPSSLGCLILRRLTLSTDPDAASVHWMSDLVSLLKPKGAAPSHGQSNQGGAAATCTPTHQPPSTRDRSSSADGGGTTPADCASRPPPAPRHFVLTMEQVALRYEPRCGPWVLDELHGTSAASSTAANGFHNFLASCPGGASPPRNSAQFESRPAVASDADFADDFGPYPGQEHSAGSAGAQASYGAVPQAAAVLLVEGFHWSSAPAKGPAAATSLAQAAPTSQDQPVNGQQQRQQKAQQQQQAHDVALHSVGLQVAAAHRRGSGWAPWCPKHVQGAGLQASGYNCVLQEGLLRLAVKPCQSKGQPVQTPGYPSSHTFSHGNEAPGGVFTQVEVTNQNLIGNLTADSALLLVRLLKQCAPAEGAPARDRFNDHPSGAHRSSSGGAGGTAFAAAAGNGHHARHSTSGGNAAGAAAAAASAAGLHSPRRDSRASEEIQAALHSALCSMGGDDSADGLSDALAASILVDGGWYSQVSAIKHEYSRQ